MSSRRRSPSRRTSLKKGRNQRERDHSYSMPQGYRGSRSRSYRNRVHQRARHFSSSSSSPFLRPGHYSRKGPSSPTSLKRKYERTKPRSHFPHPSSMRYRSEPRGDLAAYPGMNSSRRTRAYLTTARHPLATSHAARRYGGPPLSRKPDMNEPQHRCHGRAYLTMNHRLNQSQEPRPTASLNHVPVPRRRLLQSSIEQCATCPFLLRVFYNLKEHHPVEDLNEFLLYEQNMDLKNVPASTENKNGDKECISAASTSQENDSFLTSAKFERLHGSELQLYSWMDTSLRKIVDLVKDVCQEARIRGSKISLKLLHLEEDNVYKPYDLGTLHNARPGPDDKRLLLRSKFEIGDVISIAIIRLGGMRNAHAVGYHGNTNRTEVDRDAQNCSHELYKDPPMCDDTNDESLKEPNSENILEPVLGRENEDAFMERCDKPENEARKSEDHTTIVVDDEVDGHTVIDCPVQLSI